MLSCNPAQDDKIIKKEKWAVHKKKNKELEYKELTYSLTRTPQTSSHSQGELKSLLVIFAPSDIDISGESTSHNGHFGLEVED